MMDIEDLKQLAIYAIEETGGKFSYSASVLREQVKHNTDLIAKREAQS